MTHDDKMTMARMSVTNLRALARFADDLECREYALDLLQSR